MIAGLPDGRMEACSTPLAGMIQDGSIKKRQGDLARLKTAAEAKR